jgi:hypothetical protein
MTLNGNERVGIAQIRIIIKVHHLFFFPDEALNFVAFHVFHGDVHYQMAHELLALLASGNEQTANGIPMQIGHALDRANAGTFDEQLERDDSLFNRNRHEPLGFSCASVYVLPHSGQRNR